MDSRCRFSPEVPATIPRIARAATFLACAALSLFPVSATWAAGQSVQVDNGAVPEHGIRALEARELWRIGGRDADHFFGVVARAFTGPEGNIYFVDSQLSEVQVYSGSGAYLRTLSREGEGPGEVRRPIDGCWLPDGTLGLVQPYPGSVIKLHPDGTPAGSVVYGAGQGGFAALVRALGRGGSFALAGVRMTFGQDGRGMETRFLSLCGPDGTERRCAVRRETPVDYSNYMLDERGQDFIWARCDLGPEGQLVVAPDRNDYRIEVYLPDGQLARVITRQYTSLPRNDHLRQAARRLLEAYGRYIPNAKADITIEETEPDITGLRVIEDGSLWVRTSRGDWEAPSGSLLVLDRFAPDGKFLEQVALTCPGDLNEDEIFLLSADRLIRVVGGAEAALTQMGAAKPGGEKEDSQTPLEVVCYDISQ
jgi:hypothetical protein